MWLDKCAAGAMKVPLPRDRREIGRGVESCGTAKPLVDSEPNQLSSCELIGDEESFDGDRGSERHKQPRQCRSWRFRDR